MAVMWPKSLPSHVVRNTLRSTECTVFRQLESELDDSFAVYYSRPWLGLREDGEEIDGECDFVVAHARLGLLALEAKGGAVAYDPRSDRWTSRDRWNVRHNIKNPVQQARSAKHQILKKLHDYRKSSARWVRARHGVVLPHSSEPPGDLGADMPRRVFCFAERFRDGFGEWIVERFGSMPRDGGPSRELGRDGFRALEMVLAKPVELRISLGGLLSDDDDALQLLTQGQFHILRQIAGMPRATICGGAGTGKTVLAMEEASRWADRGARVLYVCYNRGLAADVRERLLGWPAVSVMTFHQLCAEMTARAGIACPGSITESRLFEEVYPDLLMQAFERLPEQRYDVIVADEGQDFLPLWWTAVDAGLAPDGMTLVRIFYDSNQRVYGSASRIPEEVTSPSTRLTLNLRNTQCIHRVVRRHYQGHEIESNGPEGVDVRWIVADSKHDVRRRITDYVRRLTGVEGVGHGDIAVLAAAENEIGDILREGRLGKLRVGRCDAKADGHIVVDTVRRFKGLERPVVIIAATTAIVLDSELPYVALSRARTHLVVVGSAKVLERLRRPDGDRVAEGASAA